ncbi:aldehyde dehydrogenase family protein [Henriciella aquimarina]|uniref:aldehyde dehydrogenase family protein n=1 Tax=Henriciella aquimarina TaxID=545261 RepID=UPI000A06FE5C|nr:aldehyde dehydrogenase family protein [Henriciella aquimarina]
MLDKTKIGPVKLRIGHEDRDTGTGGSHDHLDPVTQQVQASFPLAGKTEVDEAVEKAEAAKEAWRRMPPETRRDLLNRLAGLIEENAEAFAERGAVDGGTPLFNGMRMVETSVAWARYYAGWCDKLSGELISTLDTRGEFAYTVPEPKGTVGIIITWNGPLISLCMKVIPALAAGNCCVVKPAELTPFAPDLFAILCREAGIPDGVVSILPGTGEAGQALVAHPKVSLISFTGGPVTARKIMSTCAEHIKPSIMELGGKSASLLFPDVDLKAACERAIFWTIGIMAGQGCALPTRLLVHEDIFNETVETLKAITAHFKVGDPFEDGVLVGPVINTAARDRIMAMLERVRSNQDGQIVMGGKLCGGSLEGGNFIEPTIVVDAPLDSEISQEEIFGPVLLVNRFKDEEEAVEMANATAYGLAAYIQTNDLKRAHRLSERLVSGGVYINGATQINPHTPFGGVGISGFGKEGGRAGIDAYLNYKTVTIANN